uniref:Uncharacterized protein TCIL3000_9_2300 n=1 Tax=Trypanosoma congolense (strain IL3000) TaxID=1068625 RepID=G0UTW9_TRYCI|nr:unnamed protein product [Trypanosoma congolense IL3000]
MHEEWLGRSRDRGEGANGHRAEVGGGAITQSMVMTMNSNLQQERLTSVTIRQRGLKNLTPLCCFLTLVAEGLRPWQGKSFWRVGDVSVILCWTVLEEKKAKWVSHRSSRLLRVRAPGAWCLTHIVADEVPEKRFASTAVIGAECVLEPLGATKHVAGVVDPYETAQFRKRVNVF